MPAGHTAAREMTKQHLSCPALQACSADGAGAVQVSHDQVSSCPPRGARATGRTWSCAMPPSQGGCQHLVQPLAPGSDCRGLLDAVEADAGRGGGDGHGPGHAGTDGVLVLPAVPPLPHGRSHLGQTKEGFGHHT